ncbi:hypothetical protein [Mycobacteroides abscessus]|uniref:hypothetical protein n=1 Tax=Mycobacteroides abscessus TaxID=36809 RepID=UPI0011C3CF14|nr:hypothetical protein [Mycobacteroides abscessus]
MRGTTHTQRSQRPSRLGGDEVHDVQAAGINARPQLGRVGLEFVGQYHHGDITWPVRRQEPC